MLHTVIFDVGGTLIGAPDIFQRLAQVFPQGGQYNIRQIIAETFNRYYRGEILKETGFLNIEEMIRKTLFEVSSKLGCEDMCHLAGEIYWDNFVNNSKLYSDTIETLTRLDASSIKIIIASDADAPLLYEQFKIHKLSHFFDALIISSEVRAYKPSDDFAKALMPYLKGSLSGVLFVGDSDADILTGRKLGVRTVLKGALKQDGVLPDFRIDKLTDIFKLEPTL